MQPGKVRAKLRFLLLIPTLLVLCPAAYSQDKPNRRDISNEEWSRLTADTSLNYKNEIEPGVEDQYRSGSSGTGSESSSGTLGEDDRMGKRRISDKNWQSITRDSSFGYKDEVESAKPKEKPANNWLANLLGLVFSSGIWIIIFWVVMAAVIIWVIYTIAGNSGNFLFSKKKNKLSADEAPDMSENLEDTNWEKLMQEAIARGDLRLATRHTYMWLLQLLQHKQLIAYSTDKTNFDYYQELSGTKYKTQFKSLSRSYEYAFYGNYAPDKVAFGEYSALFNELKNQLTHAR